MPLLKHGANFRWKRQPNTTIQITAHVGPSIIDRTAGCSVQIDAIPIWLMGQDIASLDKLNDVVLYFVAFLLVDEDGILLTAHHAPIT